MKRGLKKHIKILSLYPSGIQTSRITQSTTKGTVHRSNRSAGIAFSRVAVHRCDTTVDYWWDYKLVEEKLNKALVIILPVTFCSYGAVRHVTSVVITRKRTASPELILKFNNLLVRRGELHRTPKKNLFKSFEAWLKSKKEGKARKKY